MKRILFEAIVANVEDAVAAEEGGADRFELCSALALGGLTPSLGTVREIKAETTVPVMTMVRPREGGMAYSNGEFRSMLRDAELFVDAGAGGLVFGFLTPDAEVDVARCQEFLRVARSAAGKRPIQTCFHRAFDVVSDPEIALEQLIDLGVSRILTSGRAPTALQGVRQIRQMVQLADGRIEILPGGGIDAKSLLDIVDGTGADQVHLYLTRVEEDRSVTRNPEIYFGAHVPTSELEYHVVDRDSVRKIRNLLDTGAE